MPRVPSVSCKILSAIFYKSKVSKKEQAKKGSNGQELREVVPFGERKGTSEKD